MRAGRKKIRDLNEILKRKEQYDADKYLYDETYGHAAQVLAASMAAAVLYGIHLDNLEHTKEYRKKKMKNAYDSLRRVYDLPQVFGKIWDCTRAEMLTEYEGVKVGWGNFRSS